MQFNVLLVLVILTILPFVVAKQRKYSRLKTDSLSKTRCDLVCFDAEKSSKSLCRTQCRAEEKKPGTCPTTDSPSWAAACVEACISDAHCDGTQRCCHHGCGSACSEPVDLFTIPGLPALPTMFDTVEKRKSILIKWSDGVGDAARAVPGRVLYLLEEQHHVGPKYEEGRLGEWNLLLRTNKTKVSLKNLLKPGRWYRFRVAAVSSTGTRGFSAPSKPFTPRRGPRPPAPPRRLRVRTLKSDNATVTIRMEWKEPRSDLPVLRYKVYWSRRVRGLGGELDSVLVNHQTVPKDQTYFDITDLQPNSMYFLQVQTLTQFGTGKLRSEKSEIFYNTTNSHDNSPDGSLKRKRHIKTLKLQKILWLNNKIRARVSWDDSKKTTNKRYIIKWKPINCRTQKSTKELSANTDQTTFEIYDLNYNCSYKVNVSHSEKLKNTSSEAELLISIPGCDYFQRRVNGTTLYC